MLLIRKGGAFWSFNRRPLDRVSRKMIGLVVIEEGRQTRMLDAGSE